MNNNYNELERIDEYNQNENEKSNQSDIVNFMVGLGVITLTTIGAVTTCGYVRRKIKERREFQTQDWTNQFEQELMAKMIMEGKSEEEIKNVINTLRRLNKQI